MSNPQIQAQNKIFQIILHIRRFLEEYSPVLQYARDLEEDQSNIIACLNQKSIQYQNFLGILAIQSYITSLIDHFKKFDDIQIILTTHIESILNFEKTQNTNFMNNYQNLYSTLVTLVKACQQFAPNSNHSIIHNEMLENPSNELQYCQIKKLKQQNIILKQKLQTMDQTIIDLQYKLTNLLKQYNQNQQYSNSNTLKQSLIQKQQQIQRMNEQFSYEIQKYNTVFQSMKDQLNQLRSYHNMDLISQIQKLQTQIIRYREEKQRDQLVINQLTDRLAYNDDYDPRRSGVMTRYRSKPFLRTGNYRY